MAGVADIKLFVLDKRHWARILGILVTVIGIVVLIGWQFHIRLFQEPIPHLVAMNPITAISFVLFGTSFTALIASKPSKSKQVLGNVLAIVVILLALAKIAGVFFPSAIQIDHLFYYRQILSNIASSASNGMAITTAGCFIMSGVALLCLNYETRNKRKPADLLAAIVFFTGFFSLICYAYKAPEYYDLLRFLPMAIHTAFNFVLVALAILLAHADKGLPGQFTLTNSGNIIARLLLPASLLIPTALGWATIRLYKATAITTELSIAVFVIMITAIFCSLTIYNVIVLNRRDLIQKRAEAKFKGLLESAPDAVVIVSKEGRMLFVNLQTEKLFGYKREEMIGQPVEMLMPDRLRHAHAGHKEHFFSNPKTREMGLGLELFGKRKDETEFYVEISLSPFESEEGVLVSASIRDITEKKKAEEKLRQSEERLRSLVNSTKDYAIYMLDKNGNIATWNKGAELTKGYKEEEIKGKNFSRFFIEEDIANNIPVRLLQKAESHGRSEVEGWRVRKDGSQFWGDVVITSLFDNDSRLVGFASVTRDMTDWKAAKDTLTHFNEELSRQVDEKTHELEDTMTELRRLSAHLDSGREEERKNIAREIHDELGQMLTALRMDLVWLKKHVREGDETFTERLEAALGLLNDTRQTMRRISTDLHPAILEDLGLIAALERQCKDFEDRTTIDMEFETELSGIQESDINHEIKIGIYRIFQESLTNIAKHSGATTVNGYLKNEDAGLVLSISDNGSGFDVAKVTKKKTLGLVSIRERVLMMGGKHEIFSIPGEGTTIMLSIPLTKTS